jgi:hypothetical protein
VSTAEPTSISLAELTPLQTFVAPTEACPVALSVLWMPISMLQQELPEPIWRLIFKDGRHVSHNPRNAIRHFMSCTIRHEQQLATFFLKIADPPPIGLMRYAVMLHDWHASDFPETHLLATNIIIQRSPPSEEILGKLLSSGVIGLGAYAGISIVPADANPYLLLACVSGGIICISTAAGIGRALQDGIYERLLGLFGSTPARKKKGR